VLQWPTIPKSRVIYRDVMGDLWTSLQLF